MGWYVPPTVDNVVDWARGRRIDRTITEPCVSEPRRADKHQNPETER